MKDIFCMKPLVLIFSLLATVHTNAQKLPNKQELGLRTPNNIKIDGKPMEIGSKFEAFNPATGLYYSITNNDKIVYIVFQATDPDIINRVTGGGITFTVKGKADKKDAGVSVTYPIINGDKSMIFRLIAGKGQKLDTSTRAVDSTMRVNNKRLDDNFKWIKVNGIKGLDTLSIYNTENIQAAGKFDAKRAYTVEISLPLQLLRNYINDNSFTYQIRVNGAKPITIGMGKMTGSTDPAGAARALESLRTALNSLNAARTAQTDVSGEYVLAK